jgi:hypothetical protein
MNFTKLHGFVPFSSFLLQGNLDQKAAEMIKGAGFTTLEMEMDCDIAVVLAVKRAKESERGALKDSSSWSWLGDF